MIEALQIIDKGWKNLKPLTIQNCFSTCGFKNITIKPQDETNNYNAFIAPQQWNDVNEALNVQNPTPIEDFVDIAKIAVYGRLTDLDIVESINQNSNNSDNDTENKDSDDDVEEKLVQLMPLMLLKN